ncbi:MAG: hypothetical protein WCA31_05490 [Acidimicrobiales bacterium]
MELVRLVAPLARRDALVALATPETLFHCSDADTVIVTASLRDQLRGALGVWLRVSDDYSAQLCARDVKTLSHLVNLRHVAIEAEEKSPLYAEIVRALLTDDAVNFSNEVATIRGAYNRPAPPAPISVWSVDGEVLTNGGASLRARRTNSSRGADLTYFS